MSVWTDMARQAGWGGENMVNVAAMLEEQYQFEAERATPEGDEVGWVREFWLTHVPVWSQP